MNVIEVERKRELIGTCAAVQARLGEWGYHTHGCVVEVDTYYSRPEVDYLATVECLRVRQRDGFAEINVAVSLDTVSGVGIFIETEVTAVNPDGATALLEQIEHQLGLTVHPVVSVPYRDLVLRHDQPSTRNRPN